MGEKNTTLFRTLAMLQIIPKEPGYKATSTIHVALEEKGFKVDLRTVQRDLKALANHFPLIWDSVDGERRWGFAKTYTPLKVGFDTPTALTLVLAQKYLSGLLPQIAVDQISRQFDYAHQYLDGLPKNHYSNWVNRVKAIPNGKTLIPASLKNGIWQTVSSSVLEEFAIDVTYLNRKKNELKEYTLHPLAIVVRDSVTYLVASVNDYKDPLQFALHRIQKVERSEKEYAPIYGFNLDDYVERGEFGYLFSSEEVQLKANVKKDIAWMLSETPISKNQTLEEINDDWFLLTALVPNEKQTLKWLMSYGADMDVIEPLEWREHIFRQAKETLARMKSIDYK